MLNFHEIELNLPKFHERQIVQRLAELDFSPPVRDKRIDNEDFIEMKAFLAEFKDRYVNILALKIQRAIFKYPHVVNHGLKPLVRRKFMLRRGPIDGFYEIYEEALDIAEKGGLFDYPTYVCFVEVAEYNETPRGKEYIIDLY